VVILVSHFALKGVNLYPYCTEPLDEDAIVAEVRRLEADVAEILGTARRGRLLDTGVSVAIVGRVGTSHHVILQSKHGSIGDSHVTNPTPGSANPTRGPPQRREEQPAERVEPQRARHRHPGGGHHARRGGGGGHRGGLARQAAGHGR
jgi:hypothetical protein